MNLFINYYDDPHRQHELDKCLEANISLDIIKRVIVFDESKNGVTSDKKIIRITQESRPTYQDFFNATKDYPNDVNIISNADIMFNGSLQNARNISSNECYAITRSETDKDGVIIGFEAANNHASGCKSEFSQDVWIFRGASKMEGCHMVTAINNANRQYSEIPFTIGVPGCDNVIAAKLKTRYKVLNPADQIRCVHVHKQQKRRQYEFRITGTRSFWGVIQNGRVPISTI